MKSKKGNGVILIIIVFIIILIWGIIGGIESNSIGVTCDIGIGDTLCWQWHTNTFGQISEGVKNLF